jgi:hypothetical protein
VSEKKKILIKRSSYPLQVVQRDFHRTYIRVKSHAGYCVHLITKLVVLCERVVVKELDGQHIRLGVLDWELKSLIPTRLKGFVDNFALSALVAFANEKPG